MVEYHLKFTKNPVNVLIIVMNRVVSVFPHLVRAWLHVKKDQFTTVFVPFGNVDPGSL
jgi:hypothetical protein